MCRNIFLNKWLRPGAGPSGMSGLPLHWVLYSTHVPTGPTNLDRALQVSPPGWAHSLEEGPNRLGVACGHFSRKFGVGLGTSALESRHMSSV